MVFMPVFAQDCPTAASQLGLLMSASGIGAVLGALQFAARTNYTGMVNVGWDDVLVLPRSA